MSLKSVTVLIKAKKFTQLSYEGVTLSNLLHIFFGYYFANTKNINVTTLSINVII